MVIDNTNPTIEGRKRYIIFAKKNRFKIIGYCFSSNLEECKQRNNNRSHPIPLVGLIDTYKKLQLPTYQEGFERLYCVSIGGNNSFIIKKQNAI